MARQRLFVNINTDTAPEEVPTMDLRQILPMLEGRIRRIPKSEWLTLLGYAQTREQRALRVNHYFLDNNNQRISTPSTMLQNISITLDVDTEELVIDLTNVDTPQDLNQKVKIMITFA